MYIKINTFQPPEKNQQQQVISFAPSISRISRSRLRALQWTTIDDEQLALIFHGAMLLVAIPGGK